MGQREARTLKMHDTNRDGLNRHSHNIGTEVEESL